MKSDTANKLQPINCELNVLSRSDGSAMLSQGQTVCVASVYGPIEVKLQNLDIDKANIEVYYRPKAGLSSVTDRLKEKIVRNTCNSALIPTLHPRTAISIQIQEMEDKGGLIACALNAAFMALLNSGLELKYSIAAVHCVIDDNDQVLLDPDNKVCLEAVGHLTFVFESVNKSTVATHTDGRFTIGQYNEALMVARSASVEIFNFYRDIVKKFSKEL